MSALSWFYLAAAGWGLAAATLAAARGASRAIRVSCVLSALGGAAAVAGGVSSLWWGDSHVVTAGGSVVAGTMQLQATSLAGVFAALLGLVAAAIAAYTWPFSTSRC